MPGTKKINVLTSVTVKTKWQKFLLKWMVENQQQQPAHSHQSRTGQEQSWQHLSWVLIMLCWKKLNMSGLKKTPDRRHFWTRYIGIPDKWGMSLLYNVNRRKERKDHRYKKLIDLKLYNLVTQFTVYCVLLQYNTGVQYLPLQEYYQVLFYCHWMHCYGKYHFMWIRIFLFQVIAKKYKASVR